MSIFQKLKTSLAGLRKQVSSVDPIVVHLSVHEEMLAESCVQDLLHTYRELLLSPLCRVTIEFLKEPSHNGRVGIVRTSIGGKSEWQEELWLRTECVETTRIMSQPLSGSIPQSEPCRLENLDECT